MDAGDVGKSELYISKHTIKQTMAHLQCYLVPEGFVRVK
jgi:hypothetical protein